VNSPDPRIAEGWQPDYRPATVECALTASVCERTIAVAHEIGFANSPVYGDRGPEENTSYRKSQSAYLHPQHYRELYGIVPQIVQTVNAEYYRFQLQGVEPLQVIKYEPGGLFHEHTDIGTGNSKMGHRKLSLIIQLSEPQDYEGGAVILAGNPIPRERGSGGIFPSWTPHRVEELTSGTRYSLVTWATGPHFR
jgi:PKHD-type hydroxylase